ncbi:hypothetical protein, partial [Segatella oulorum]|uniref:hypothetical protein n=1 Tax=Segatella oulorum TaxID=28136 RepID=UPI0023F3D315
IGKNLLWNFYPRRAIGKNLLWNFYPRRAIGKNSMWNFYLGASRVKKQRVFSAPEGQASKNNGFFLRPRVKRQKTTMFSCIWEEKAR